MKKHNTTGKANGEMPASGKPAEAAHPEIDAVDALQLALDLAGMIPGAGAVPDILNAAISLMRGDFLGAAFSVFSAVPAVGDIAGAAKIAKNAGKYMEALAVVEAKVLPKLPKKLAEPLKEFIDKARKKLDEIMGAEKPKPKPEPEPPPKKTDGPEGNQVKKKNTGEKGKCGEWLAKMDMVDEGFDEVVAVQNNSGHGVDLIGRNSQTGEVKVWEVKTTDSATPPPLSKPQQEMGGARYSADRLGKAAEGYRNYGKVPEAMENAKRANKWLEKAGNNVTYEKREVFVDDLEKGCAKHPKRPSRSQPW